MLLIYSLTVTQRISYVFKHICTRILGIEISFTSQINEFVSYSGPKISYGKKPLANEFFIKSYGLLNQQGFESIDVMVKQWEDTKCFFSVGRVSKLPFDIFSASFYLLSRYEEYLPHVKDEKGRFLASESIAFKEDFLIQPVVDIWAYKFKRELENSFPELSFPTKNLQIHSLIDASIPFLYQQKGFFRSFSGVIKEISSLRLNNTLLRIAVSLGLKEDPYLTFNWIIDQLKKYKTNTTTFFLLGEAWNFYEGTNYRRKKFKLLIKKVSDYMPVGLMFSKDALMDFEKLKKEKKLIESINNTNLEKSVNTNFLLSLPNDYRKLVELEIKEDFTMVYENKIGFRASTCTPFLFYDLDYEIVSPLLIHPLALTTSSFNDEKEDTLDNKLESLINSVNKVNGSFSIYFKNQDFSTLHYQNKWKDLFLKLATYKKNQLVDQ